MTAQHAEAPNILPRPAETPTAIRAVLAANADAEVLREYDEALDAAYAEAKRTSSLEPLTKMIRRWWFEADNWRDPVKHRARLADVDDIVRNGLGDRPRHKAADVFAAWEAEHGQKLNRNV